MLKFSRSGRCCWPAAGTAARQGRVVVFDVKTGKRVFEVGDELDAVLAADINDDHTRIALGGPGKVVRVYLHGRRQRRCKRSASTPIGSMRSNSAPTACCWPRPTAAPACSSGKPTRAANIRICRATRGRSPTSSWRIDSNLLASASEDGTIKLWEMENGNQVKNWNAHPAASPRSALLTTAGWFRPAAIASPKSGMATAPSRRPSSAGRHRPAGRSSPTTAPAWWPATGWAKSDCGKAADGKTGGQAAGRIRRRWRWPVEAETGKVRRGDQGARAGRRRIDAGPGRFG